MIFQSVQVGESTDVGPRDENGLPHGKWEWFHDVNYVISDEEAREKSEYKTQSCMSVIYNHGKIEWARLDYDVTKKATTTYEEGKEVGELVWKDNTPFKKGIWRGKNKMGNITVSFYDGACAVWRYEFDKKKGWILKLVEKKDGKFHRWIEPYQEDCRPPPPENEWPLEYNPLKSGEDLQAYIHKIENPDF